MRARKILARSFFPFLWMWLKMFGIGRFWAQEGNRAGEGEMLNFHCRTIK